MFPSQLKLRRHNLTVVALLCALCFWSAFAHAQNAGQNGAQPLSGRDMAPVVGAVPIAVSTAQLRGAPLFWASGITEADDLPAYKSIGLNTVVVRLSWNPDADPNNLAALEVAPQRAFAEAAARAGLKVIYALPPAPQNMEFKIRIAGDSPSYNLFWTAWASKAIETLRGTPNLAGWMLPDDPRSLPMWSDEGFRRWIGRNYATIDVLNQQWGTVYRDLSDVRIEDVAALAERNRDLVGKKEFALGQLGTAPNPTVRNAAFHPAQLALAAYRREAYRELLVTWIGVVRGADPSHLVFSGEMPDYAQMLSMPAGVDVMMPAMPPGIAENDIVTHNPQAIDIARRGGKFAALPVFSVRGTGMLPEAALPELSKRWLQEACARGAVGVGLDSWPDLKGNFELRQALLEKLRDLNGAPNLALWGEPPVATTAIVLAPLADGATVNYGPIALGGKRGLYGWGENLIEGEPSNLVWALRWGTAFGGVDYLAPEDLDGPLDIYNTILAPQMLSCSLQNQTSLTNYVTAGGVLIADLGLGALQSGGQIGTLPPAMSLLFGVPGSYDVRPTSFNLQGAATHELLPAWNRMIRLSSKVTLTRGDAPGGNAFEGPVGFSLAYAAATVIGVGPQIGTNVANGRPALWTAPLTANSASRGTAIFAPFRMWTHWRPGHTGFDGFHGDLMARGATIAVSQNRSGPVSDVMPDTTNTAEGITRFPEIVNRPREVTFINHDAPGQPQQLASVETTGVGDWLWSGGVAQLPNAQGVALTGGRPAPIENASSFESRTRPLGLFAGVAQGEMVNLRMEPISAQNLGGGPLCGQVVSNTRAGAEIYVWPNAMEVLPDSQGRAWQPIPNVPGKFRLTVCSSPGGVNWTPGARVRAVVTSASVAQGKRGDKTNISNDQLFAVVDARGRATWELEGSSVRVQIAGG